VVVPSLVMAGVTTRGRAKVRVMARSRRSAGGKKVFETRAWVERRTPWLLRRMGEVGSRR
jgi:hypothetical protein